MKEETWTPLASVLGVRWEEVELIHWITCKKSVARPIGVVHSNPGRRSSGSPAYSGGQVASPCPDVQLPSILHQHPSQLHGQAQLPSFQELIHNFSAAEDGSDLASSKRNKLESILYN
jgi:hypothetical protein